MKSFIILNSLLFFITSLQAQTKLPFLISTCQQCYLYNKEQDTLALSTIDLGKFCSCLPPVLVDSIQLNGQGAKEVVLFRSCMGSTENHGGTFDISEKKHSDFYEIWNLDTKEMLFKAVSYYFHEYHNFMAYSDPTHKNGIESYAYKFEIDEKGRITISEPSNNPSSIPDKAAGSYSFQNGKYVLEE